MSPPLAGRVLPDSSFDVAISRARSRVFGAPPIATRSRVDLSQYIPSSFDFSSMGIPQFCECGARMETNFEQLWSWHALAVSQMHWLFVVMALMALTLFAIPVANILHRTGHSRWWTLVAVVPLVNMLFLWAFAFGPWPAMKERSRGAGRHD
jgi:hypothetical protein